MSNITVNVNQPDVADALREMREAAADSRRHSDLMEQRAAAAEQRMVTLAAREVPAPIVHVAAPEVRVAAPEVTVNPVLAAPTPAAPVVNVTVPDTQTVHIASLPPMKAKVKRDRSGRIEAIEE